MAASMSALLSVPPVASSSLSSSFLPRSQRLATSSYNPACSSSSSRTAGFARCATASHERVAETSLYGVLGLEQGVGLTDIKTAYRMMARRYHPDVCPPSEKEECTRMFLQVQDAYEVLSDPERRAKYDYQLMNPLSANALGWGNMVRRDGSNGDGNWKAGWQDQLSRFEKRTPREGTWGAKMRARRGDQS